MIPKYSVKRPYTVLVAVVLVIVLGVVSLTRMTTDLLPAMNLPYVIVVTTDVGASPEEVEKDVTSPIEAAMATTSNINNVSSMSYDNYSMVILEYEQSTNMDSAMIEIQQQLDQLTGQFPDSAGSPVIMQIDPDMMPVMIASADVDGMDQAEVSNYVDNELLPLLESIEGVASVTATGVLDTDLQVTMNQEKIDALNEQILSKIDARFTDAQAELDKASSQIDSGKKKLSDSEKEMGSQLGAGENEIINNKIQLFNTEADLTTQLSDLQKSQSSMDGAIKSLQSAYDGATQLQSAIDGLQKAKDGVSQAKSGAKQLYQAHDGVMAILTAKNPMTGADMTVEEALAVAVQYGQMTQEQANQLKTVISTLQADPKMLEAYKNAASESDFVAYMESTAIAQINAQAGTSYTSESDIASQIVTLQYKLDDINVMLMSQASSFADAGVTLTSYKDIPAAISKLSESKTQIAAGIATIESAQTQVADGKTSLDDALVTLNESQISGIMEMSKGYADLAVAANKIEEGQSQLDDAKEQAKDSADLNTILTMDTLKNLLTAQNFSMPAGYVQDASGESWLLKVGEEYNSVKDISGALLLHVEGYGDVRLSDVADVEIIDNAADSYTRLNGEQASVLKIYKDDSSSAGDVSANCLDAFKELEAQYEGLHVVVLSNQGNYISILIKSILTSMLVGAALAIVVLAIFLKDVKPTLVVGVSIPLSVLFAVVLMYFTGLDLNVMTLAGLSLGIGMLVDNSVVVIENIYRLRGRGVPAARAAVQGARQVGMSVVASTLTSVCVFLPAVFSASLIRNLMGPMSLCIGYCLMASLIVALTVVPAASATVLKNAQPKKLAWFDKIQNAYGRSLEKALQKRFVPLAAAVLLLVFCCWRVVSMGIVLLPTSTSNEALITLSTTDTLSKEESYDVAGKVVQAVMAVDGVEEVGITPDNTVAGMDVSNLGLPSTITDLLNAANGYGKYKINVKLNEELSSSKIDAACKAMEEAVAGVADCTATVQQYGMTDDLTSQLSTGLTIKIYGTDAETLTALSEKVVDIVNNTEGFQNATNGLGAGDSTIILQVDRDKVRANGLTVAQVYQQIAAKLTTTTTAQTPVTVDGTTMDVQISNNLDPLTKENMMDMTFETTVMSADGTTATGTCKLSDIASWTTGTAPDSITSENRNQFVTVTAETAPGYNTTVQARAVKKALDAFALTDEMPEGCSFSMGGESDSVNYMTDEMIQWMALALPFVYLVMVAQFQSLLSPFIVLFTVPLAFTGGLLGLLLTGQQLTMISMMGFIVLMGTVVNNGIVFVDYANQLRMGGMERRAALVATGKTRMRPILMTTLTTVLAMLQMVFSNDMASQLMSGMAIVIICGLSYATLMTLYIVPILYDILFKKPPLNVDIGSDKDLDDIPDDAAEFIAAQSSAAQPQPEA